ncbi:tRNA-histidine guanylyltransferase 1-like [Neopestalotiopsis sp. 37M]|nr:tRNA-histidine guanylyltransferase 1-like [Neopestalotiopsis sp. 37M]
MANSRFEYVKAFEQADYLMPNTWIVVRIDGRGFTKLCTKYGFEKPNDRRALDLMNAAAKAVMTELPDITIGYGVSDEYSHNAAEVADDIAEPVKQSKTQQENDRKRRAKARVMVEHLDIIKDDFWDRRPWLLSNKPGKVPKQT